MKHRWVGIVALSGFLFACGAAQHARPERTEVKVGNVDLEVTDVGEGRPVLFIHGSLLADANVPLLREPALREHYRLISYRRRGYGRRPAGGPVSLQDQAADAVAVLRSLGVARADVVGHSYGAAIALQLAHDAPAQVATLTLMEPPLLPAVPSGPKLMETMGPVIAAYQKGDRPGAVEGFGVGVVGPRFREIVDKMLPGGYDLALADVDTVFQVEFPALGSWRFGPEDASGLKMPVLSVVGTDTQPAFKEVHELLGKWLPQAERLEIPHATHALQLMNSDAVANGIAAFLARHG
jgi:pimeloyl-ACP methyl ester carboxylesterase